MLWIACKTNSVNRGSLGARSKAAAVFSQQSLNHIAELHKLVVCRGFTKISVRAEVGHLLAVLGGVDVEIAMTVRTYRRRPWP
jgi:hypothetical protein